MLSSNVKYIGLDVHKEAVAAAVLNGAGKLVMESIVETKASTLLDFLQGLRGELHVTPEEGTWAAWLYDVHNHHALSESWEKSFFLTSPLIGLIDKRDRSRLPNNQQPGRVVPHQETGFCLICR